MKTQRGMVVSIAFLIIFAALAKGAHDLWAATLVYLVVLALLMSLVINAYLSKTEKIKLPMLLPMALFFGSLTLSFLHSSNPSESFLGWMDWSSALLLIILSANIFRSEESKTMFLVLIVPLIWFEMGFLAIQFFRLGWAGILELRKVSGSIINANLTGAFLIFWVPPLMEQVNSSDRDGFEHWFWFSGLCGCLMALLFSLSVWAWFVVGVGLCIHTFGRKKRRNVALGSMVLALAAGALAWKFHFGSSPADRIYWWRSALEMFRAHRLYGVGVGNYPSAYLAYKIGPGLSTLYAHSIWLTLLAETGILGMVGVACLLGYFFIRADWRSPFSHGALFFLVFASANLGPEALINLLVLGIFMGIALAPTRSFSLAPRLSIAILATGLFLCAVPYVVSPFMASRITVDGIAALKEGNFQQAEKKFFNAIKLDDRSWEPYAWLAQLAFERKEIRLAVEFQQKAIDRNRLSVPLQRQLENYQRFLR